MHGQHSEIDIVALSIKNYNKPALRLIFAAKKFISLMTPLSRKYMKDIITPS